jgi:hypothetical protein
MRNVRYYAMTVHAMGRAGVIPGRREQRREGASWQESREQACGLFRAAAASLPT